MNATIGSIVIPENIDVVKAKLSLNKFREKTKELEKLIENSDDIESVKKAISQFILERKLFLKSIEDEYREPNPIRRNGIRLKRAHTLSF